jgi:hypothetical protein
MRRIHYSSGSVVTGDEIAAAVLEYAEALSTHGTADVVNVPVLLPSGNTATASLLIGPASQIASVPEELASPELHDATVVSELRRRSKALASAPSVSLFADFLPAEDYE